jgi:hypothetical protein
VILDIKMQANEGELLLYYEGEMSPQCAGPGTVGKVASHHLLFILSQRLMDVGVDVIYVNQSLAVRRSFR